MVIRFMKSNDGDWIGVYLNGELLDEGHSLNIVSVLRAILDDVKSFDVDMETYGCNCPKTWPEELI